MRDPTDLSRWERGIAMDSHGHVSISYPGRMLMQVLQVLLASMHTSKLNNYMYLYQ